MNFSQNNDEKDEVTIELTSLIDVIFMLVLFFLITTTFASAPGFKVDLPKSSVSDITRNRQDLTISIAQDRSIAINQKYVTDEELKDRLYEEAQLNPATLVIIQADQSVSHGKVVQVMDLAKQAGLSHLAIATEPKDGDASN
jgi:biopolymer transport protein ExbD